METTAAALILLLGPSTTWANPIVPPIVVVWPAAWIILLPVVFIEAMVATYILGITYGAGLRVSFWANLFSTLLGVPIGSCVNPLLYMGHLGRSPIESDLLFMVSLLLPLYFLSVLSEGWLVRRIVDEPLKSKAWRWAWVANGVTYALIAELLLCMIVQNWMKQPASPPAR
jgi:hypothetical protein